jgi:uncharacterized membrane protein
MANKAVRLYVGPGKPYDLVTVCAIVTVSVLLALLDVQGVVRWTLGFLAVFFAPGYAIVSALFPGRKAIITPSFTARRDEHTMTISLLERIIIGSVLGSAVMALAGTVITRGILNFDVWVVSVEAIAVTFVASWIALTRRARTPPEDQFVLYSTPRLSRPSLSSGERAISAILVMAVVVLAVLAVQGLGAKPVAEEYSELSIIGVDGELDSLPSVLAPGQAGLVEVTVRSHLSTTERFNLILSLEEAPGNTSAFDPTQKVEVSPGQGMSYQFELDPGRTWQQDIAFVVMTTGNQTLYLILDDGVEVKSNWLSLEIT